MLSLTKKQVLSPITLENSFQPLIQCLQRKPYHQVAACGLCLFWFPFCRQFLMNCWHRQCLFLLTGCTYSTSGWCSTYFSVLHFSGRHQAALAPTILAKRWLFLDVIPNPVSSALFFPVMQGLFHSSKPLPLFSLCYMPRAGKFLGFSLISEASCEDPISTEPVHLPWFFKGCHFWHILKLFSVGFTWNPLQHRDKRVCRNSDNMGLSQSWLQPTAISLPTSLQHLVKVGWTT